MHERISSMGCWWRAAPLWIRILDVLLVGGAFALPFLLTSQSSAGSVIINIAVGIGIYMILGLGLNVVVGYTGLLELGYVTFLATGALVGALCLMTLRTADGLLVLPGGLTRTADGWESKGPDFYSQMLSNLGDGGSLPLNFNNSVLLVILMAGLTCAVLGILRGIPTLRLTGDYYAIVTLGFGEIFFLIYLNEEWLTRGAFGMTFDLATTPKLFGTALYWDERVFYFLVLGVLLFSIFVMYRLEHSRTGRAWAAVRLDETAARSVGIHVERSKTIAFAISAFFGGVGGALYGIWQGNVSMKSLDIWESIIMLCAIVLGGMGSIRGVLLGAAILVGLQEALRQELWGIQVPPEARFLFYGMLLLFLMRFRPKGLIPRKGENCAEPQGRGGRDLYALGKTADQAEEQA